MKKIKAIVSSNTTDSEQLLVHDKDIVTSDNVVIPTTITAPVVEFPFCMPHATTKKT